MSGGSGDPPASRTLEIEGEQNRGSVPGSGEKMKSAAARRSSPRKTNLSASLTRFVGRAREIPVLEALVRESRLVTVIGPPGCGKSRLAAEVARGRVEDLEEDGGVWVASFAGRSARESVAVTIARTIGVDLGAGSADLARLGHAVAARGPMLLVLDDFDRLARGAADDIVALLEIAPELHVIVTSRLRLTVAGEVTFEVPPLALPAPGASAGECRASEAVSLLVERARAARSTFGPTDPELLILAELARKLDGLPLALELAAGRMGVLGPADLRDRLEHGLDLLTAREPGGPALKAALDWSWTLLKPSEQRALAQLSVFRGGFTLEAAERALEPGAALDALESLRDHSLLTASGAAELEGKLRFSLLETVRAYAAERLTEAGEADAAMARHAAYFLEAGGRWAAEVDRRDGARALAQLDRERENLLAVYERALEPGAAARVGEALLALLALEPVYYMRGPTSQSITLLERALGHDLDGVDDRTVALAEKALGRALRDAGRLEEAGRALAAALGRARRIGDDSLAGRVLGHQAFLAELEDRGEHALAPVDEALACAKRARDTRSEGMLLAIRGRLSTRAGRLEEAARDYDEAIRLDRSVGNRYAEAFALALRAELWRVRGRLAAARADLTSGLEMYRAFGEHRHEAVGLVDLASLDRAEGKVADARAALERAIQWFREDGSPRLGSALAELAAVEGAAGNLEVSRSLFVEAFGAARESGDAALEARCVTALAGVDEALPESRRRSAARPGERVSIGRSGRWFRIGAGQTVSLQRRHALRLVLRALLEQRLQRPGAALTQADVLEAGWPGEKVSAQAGTLRVYNALSTLRKMGLREILLSRDDGYLLDPAREVEGISEPE